MQLSLEVNSECATEIHGLDIMCLTGLVPWAGELIDACEAVSKWNTSLESVGGRRDGACSRDAKTDRRKSRQVSISGRLAPEFERFEAGLFSAVAFGLKAYAEHNPYFYIKKDCGYDVLRYEKGGSYTEHIDCSSPVTLPRLLSILIYLNDDHEGGELVFPRQQIKLKPAAGSMLIFPSIGTHPHEALPVTAGIKYAVVTWAY